MNMTMLMMRSMMMMMRLMSRLMMIIMMAMLVIMVMMIIIIIVIIIMAMKTTTTTTTTTTTKNTHNNAKHSACSRYLSDLVLDFDLAVLEHSVLLGAGRVVCRYVGDLHRSRRIRGDWGRFYLRIATLVQKHSLSC